MMSACGYRKREITTINPNHKYKNNKKPEEYPEEKSICKEIAVMFNSGKSTWKRNVFMAL